MGDQERGGDKGPEGNDSFFPIWPRGIDKIKRKLHERRAERKQETAQERSARITAYATVAIAVLTVVAATLGTMQWSVMKGQLEAMQADQRPWIAIDTVLGGPLSYDGMWRATGTYTVGNVGKTPGIDFDAGGALMPDIDSAKGGKMLSRDEIKIVACLSPILGQVFNSGQEDVIFPGQREIKRTLSFLGPTDFFSTEKTVGYTGSFLAITCALYYTSGSQIPHYTGRVYVLSKRDGTPIDLKGETVPLENLKFEPRPMHSGFAD